MAMAKRRHDWQRTAGLMTVMANIHRDPKRGRAFRPEDFHPLGGAPGRREDRNRITTSDPRILKALFIDKRIPRGLIAELQAKSKVTTTAAETKGGEP
jgi:hypothetical protein